MIKFVPADEKEIETVKKVRVFLDFEDDGSVVLKAKDDTGGNWSLLSLGDDGMIVQYGSIPAKLGLPLDHTGFLLLK